jgi:uncharacterized Fe-S cluster-containing MiaB family protein
MPVILPTQEAGIRRIRRIAVQSQPGQIARETLSQKKKKITKKCVAVGVGPEFKPQYSKEQ